MPYLLFSKEDSQPTSTSFSLTRIQSPGHRRGWKVQVLNWMYHILLLSSVKTEVPYEGRRKE